MNDEITTVYGRDTAVGFANVEIWATCGYFKSWPKNLVQALRSPKFLRVFLDEKLVFKRASTNSDWEYCG